MDHSEPGLVDYEALYSAVITAWHVSNEVDVRVNLLNEAYAHAGVDIRVSWNRQKGKIEVHGDADQREALKRVHWMHRTRQGLVA